jgi:hypothetical protein
MLNKNYQKNIEIFLTLPDKIKELFWDDHIISGIGSILSTNNIPEEKREIINVLIGDVLMGYISYKDFPQELLNNLSLDPLINKVVTEEIDKLIFLPVRDLLKQIYNPERVSEKKIEKQGTAGLLQKLGQPLDANRDKPSDAEVNKPVSSLGAGDREFKVAPANVIDLSQKPVEPKTEFQPKPTENNFDKPMSASQNKPVIPFFKVNLGGQSASAPNMIIGKEQTIKPTLEVSKPMDFSFGEVKPQKEKIVSDVEIQGGFGVPIKKPEIAKSIEKPSFFGKLNNIVAPKNINTQPIKVVNFASSVPPPPAIPKEEKPVDFGIKTPFISVNSPLSKNINNIPSPQISTSIPAINSVEKPIIPNLNQELPKPEIKEETMPSVPPENIVNLKKLKF